MRKRQVVIDKNHFLPIFAGDNLVQPYRFQPDVRVIVPFTEYVAFCSKMVETKYEWLAYDSEVYKRALSKYNTDRTSMLKLYFADMSRAIINELKMSLVKGKDGTVIQHQFSEDDLPKIELTSVEQAYQWVSAEAVEKASKYINADLLSYIREKMSPHNILLYKYALLLYSLSFQKNITLFRLED